MRDIRQDIQERLAGLAEQRSKAEERFKAEIDGIAAQEEVYRRALVVEENRLHNASGSVNGAGKTLLPGAANAVESGVLTVVRDGNIHGHGDIKTYLVEHGLGEDTPAFGRSLQGVLLSMRARKLVEQAGKRQWRKGAMAP